MRGKYFTLEELCRSRTAAGHGIDNSPPESVVGRLETLVLHLLDPVRELWGAPIVVNSGYRCTELNRAVGGAPGSQHVQGCAADITTGSRRGNKELFARVASSGLPFDQLIDESGYRWIHISYAPRPRGEILHL